MKKFCESLRVCAKDTIDFFPNFIFEHELLYSSVALRPENEKNVSTWYLDAKESINQGRNFHRLSYNHQG